MTLEAKLYQHPGSAPAAQTREFMRDVDVTMQALIDALRDPAHALRGDLPEIRAEERGITRRAWSTNGRLTTLAHVGDPMVNSLNTMVALLLPSDVTAGRTGQGEVVNYVAHATEDGESRALAS
jgi:hypothetical protein